MDRSTFLPPGQDPRLRYEGNAGARTGVRLLVVAVSHGKRWIAWKRNIRR